jgi:hypothetical protein
MNTRLLTEYFPPPSQNLDRNILKQLVRALEVSNESLATFQVPIMAVSADGRVYFANRAARKLLSKLSLSDRLPYLRIRDENGFASGSVTVILHDVTN